MANPTYNRVIRKLVVGFGNLFNDITLVRYNPDNSEAERMLIPIAYAAKEDYVLRLQGDYNLEKKVQMTLPRLSFEMTGMTYDASRKQNTNIKNFAQTASGVQAQYNPVPYDFDFSLYLYVRNIEDGTQVIEHILPFFTPDYTIKLNLIPEMGVVKEIPIILKDVSSEVTTEGGRDKDTRTVIWTLNFTVKGFVYGNIANAGLITHTITNIYREITTDNFVTFTLSNGIGSYQLGETVYQGYSPSTAIASASVDSTSNLNNQITLTNITGNFTSSLPIIGISSGAKYNYSSVSVSPTKYAEIDIVPSQTSNVSNNWIANTTITEYK